MRLFPHIANQLHSYINYNMWSSQTTKVNFLEQASLLTYGSFFFVTMTSFNLYFINFSQSYCFVKQAQIEIQQSENKDSVGPIFRLSN